MGRGELCLYGSYGYLLDLVTPSCSPRGNGHSELSQLLRLTKAIWAQPHQLDLFGIHSQILTHTIALIFFFSKFMFNIYR